MRDVVMDAVRGVARSWKEEAEERRKISRTDPVADALDYCAGEVVHALRQVEQATEYLTVEQYAREEQVTAQTVRTWIRRGLLPAVEGAKGYKIRKGEKRLAIPGGSPVVHFRQSA